MINLEPIAWAAAWLAAGAVVCVFLLCYAADELLQRWISWKQERMRYLNPPAEEQEETDE